jgi:hypothetical protein
MSKKDVVPLHIEWTPGWVRALNLTTGEQAEAVTLKKLGQITIGQKEALIGIGRRIVFLKAVRLPKALPEDLRRIIGVQLGQFFPLPPAQLSFDFIQTTNSTQEGLLTVIAAMKAEDLKLLQTELKDVGLTARRILPIALAAPVIAAKNGMVDALVVEAMHGDLALDVVQGSFLRFSRVTPLAADQRVEAQRTLAAANVGPVPTIISGAADLPDSTFTLDNSLKVLHEAAPFNFELAESRMLHERQRVASRMRLAVLLVVAAAAFCIGIGMQRQAAVQAAVQNQASTAKLLAPFKVEDSEESNTAATLVAVQDNLDQAFGPGQHLSDISAFVTDSLPKGAWLTGITLERDKPLQIHGTAMVAGDVSQFVDTLGASNRLRNVKLIFANSASIGTTPVVQFNVTADCVGNLPMPVPSKTALGSAVYASNDSDQGSDQ